ncbi:filamentous hemagglutinin-like protein [Pusillimonas sp. T7-7]|uniref:filamentous haemagglutinin family protein n=1 Tax=Pusillimonas sp. (strain T7-7) TaxID=1007105 RepID=UPI0002086B3F|nr:filamentous haemagglutinin family protein [Pusillimonas sp. T7-7]AEC18808.1 filamentous hemagglutinin-like protein [Pusillimonas sp. T7-7]
MRARLAKVKRGGLTLRLTPLASALILVASGLTAPDVQAKTRPFSSGWFAAKGAAQTQAARTGRLPNGMLAGINPAARQQQAARKQLNRSVQNLGSAAAAIAAQQAAQAAARAAAAHEPSAADGLAEGGLKVDADPLTAGWLNAKAPVQTQEGGRTTVTIEQTGDKAILNWETFNVGRNTTVQFQQKRTDAVLNRVNDPQARPSQIQGQIKADGTVMVVNRNGVVFSGSSQVNVRNLVAAAVDMSDAQFRERGIYSAEAGDNLYTPSFGNNLSGSGASTTSSAATGDVIVQAGAQIHTHKPASVTQGGGYVLLLGRETHNDGHISTPRGQATLAAGDSFIIRKGSGTDGNQTSTTRGNEVATRRVADSEAGLVRNTGLIQASTGDITLTGHAVKQEGVAVATTSVDQRGTIHLLNSVSDNEGDVTLGDGSVTLVLLEDSDNTALDSQREGRLTLPLGGVGDFDNLSGVADRGDLSRIEIVSGGRVTFADDSMTLATGGEIVATALERATVADGAMIDVSGAVGVKMAMEANSLQINIQGNEQRDAPVNRDSGTLNSERVWIDIRKLIYVPAGTHGYESDRWYTAGGLLEVGGYLANRGRPVGEWMAQGGTVTFTGGEVVTQRSSQINLSGGTLDVQTGYMNLSWLKGDDGRLYEVSRAPADVLYTGIYKGYEYDSERWGQTDYYYNPLIGPRRRLENGYTVGRDAGKLVVSTNEATLEGDLVGEVYQGDRQDRAPQAGLEGYYQSQKALARRAQLVVGQYIPYYLKDEGRLGYQFNPTVDTVQIGGAATDGALMLNADWLNSQQLGGLKVAAREHIAVEEALQLATGGALQLYSTLVDVNADITAHGGDIRLGNVARQAVGQVERDDVLDDVPAGLQAGVTVAEDVRLDTTGLWTNERTGGDARDRAWVNGGNISLRSTGDVQLLAGSEVDVSSGAAYSRQGEFVGGRGGDVTLVAGHNNNPGSLILDGRLNAIGAEGGGTLHIDTSQAVVIADDRPADEQAAWLLPSLFASGFSHYDIAGRGGLDIADGTQVEVTVPVYRPTQASRDQADDVATSNVLEVWLPPEHIQAYPARTALRQRYGASITLTAGDQRGTGTTANFADARIGEGAVLRVDAGQTISLLGTGNIHVEGSLVAPGGDIFIGDLPLLEAASESRRSNPAVLDRVIEIGAGARLNVAGRAYTQNTADGQAFGVVRDGGRIRIGGDVDPSSGAADGAMDAFVVIRDGARLDASGAQATVIPAGLAAPAELASRGGEIQLASNNGLLLHGDMQAGAGGEGASGGLLSLVLGAPIYLNTAPSATRAYRELVVSDSVVTNPDQPPVFGQAALSAEQVREGGFDQLSLLSEGVVSFEGDVTLALGRSLSVYAQVMGLGKDAASDARVNLEAPYVLLAGAPGQKDVLTGRFRPQLNAGGTGALSALQATSAAHLTVEAGLIDVRDQVRTSISASAVPGGGEAIDRVGFDQVSLSSTGDLRFLNNVADIETALTLPGDLDITAAQVYPATGASATITAGYLTSTLLDSERTLSISRSTHGDLPDQPHSVFGTLELRAGIIEQAGVLRAPLGQLRLGRPGTGRSAERVVLAPGSITSVSAAGLMMPYGGTVDDIAWLYGAEEIDISARQLAASSVSVAINAGSVSVQDDAVLDLSAGGDLLGAGFIPGRGGSSDVRFSPLIRVTEDGVMFPELATNPVYAIVPGVVSGYAPADPTPGVVAPLTGQQITIGDGVPGLAAGTYTLMPSTYALLPGAFRVEINGDALATGTAPMRNGSWIAPAHFSIAGTGISDVRPRQILLTPADLVRRYSHYNEASYSDFVRQSAATLGTARAELPDDAHALILGLSGEHGDLPAFEFAGTLRADRTEEGVGASISVAQARDAISMEVVSSERGATEDFEGISLTAESLNQLAENAERLLIGAAMEANASRPGWLTVTGRGGLTVREGAHLSAAEVILGAARGNAAPNNRLVIERGASINTLDQGEVRLDGRAGYTLNVRGAAVIASNGAHQVLFEDSTTSRPAPISIGVSDNTEAPAATLYSEGTLAFATGSDLLLDDSVLYGTRDLALALGAVNLGDSASLAAAATAGVLPDGFSFNQSVLERLLTGDTSTGAPAMERFSLSASQGLNVFGDITLSTLDDSGTSTLDTFVLTTPAILGAGDAGNTVTIETGHLVWNGTTGTAPALVGNTDQIGPGTGSGRLNIHADVIELGYGPNSRPGGTETVERMILGFSDVVLGANDMFTANNQGELSVYQSRGDYVTGEGWQYHGGNLRIETPVITGEAGAVSSVRAGGELLLTGAAGAQEENAQRPRNDALGATLAFQGQQITLDTNVMLPSGKLTLAAENDVILTDAARIDMAGREIVFDDVSRYSWGGNVTLESASGNIHQSAGSEIDLSAENNHAGSLTAVAVDGNAGEVLLLGDILGQSSGEYDAGGTREPYESGRVDIRAQSLGDFAALNTRLTEGEVFGARHFQIKQGDLTLGNEVRARDVSISLDNGLLTVNGIVDASGAQVGSIRLAGKQGLTLTDSAVLDAHGEILRVDSYGRIIEAPNRAIIELNSGDGALTLAGGARMDLRFGTEAPAGTGAGQHDGRALGTVTLTAPRLGSATSGDMDINVQGPVAVNGARSIAVQGNWRYDDADYGMDESANGRTYQIIDQDYLDAKHEDSEDFINGALQNDDLLARLEGLRDGNEDVFHLRPSVEIVSATPDGDLVIQGDLDLSGHRYASLNPNTQKTAVYGSGEAGALAIRAGGDLNIYGSINDGFAPPPETPDDNGWVLLPGVNPYGVDVIVPGAGVTLAQGTTFPSGRVLNYEVPLQSFIMQAGTELPVAVTLRQTITLPANTVFRGEVVDAAGNVYAAGTLLREPLVLDTNSVLGVGFMLTEHTRINDVVWPADVPLPVRMRNATGTLTDPVVLASDLALMVGAVIPGETSLILPDGVEELPIRPTMNEQQGRNWAVAAMLPSGSQSWDMRLVAGADIAAADTRSTQPRGVTGDLILSDHHYQFAGIWQSTGESTTVWAEGNFLGMPAGEEVSENDLFICDFYADVCVTQTKEPTLVWAEGNFLGMPAGQEVAEGDLFICDFYADVCELVGGAGEEELVGRVYSGESFSVIRTGTGDMDLISRSDLRVDSLYGIYTAGTPLAEVSEEFSRNRIGTDDTALGTGGSSYEHLVNGGDESTYHAWFPENGGHLLVRAGGDVSGTVLTTTTASGTTQDIRRAASTPTVTNWLWRQGPENGDGAAGTAWWINFGSYVRGDSVETMRRTGGLPTSYPDEEMKAVREAPFLTGFTGFGTLGGGNFYLDIAGDAGVMTAGKSRSDGRPRSEGLVLAVGSTGRVIENDALLMSGGGDLSVRIGGHLNPATATLQQDGRSNAMDLGGALINLRGNVLLSATSVGGIERSYRADTNSGITWQYQRSPYDSTLGNAMGGPVLIPGDATYHIQTGNDLVVGGVGDAGRVQTVGTERVAGGALDDAWFSLWTDHTAIHLFSVGGDLMPGASLGQSNARGTFAAGFNYVPDGMRFSYPSILKATAASGNIYLGAAAWAREGVAEGYGRAENLGIWFRPSENSAIELLAMDHLYGGGYSLSSSSAPQTILATPFQPAVILRDGTGAEIYNNVYERLRPGIRTPFAFGANTVGETGQREQVNRYYAVNGDIVNLRVGEQVTFSVNRGGDTWYVSGGPVQMLAGRDIVNSGSLLGSAAGSLNDSYQGATSRGNLFLHHNDNDISRVHADGRILTSNFNVAGPGQLEVSAGGSILMQDQASIVSLGPVVPGDNRRGADIAVMAGLAESPLDVDGLLSHYLDPANLAAPDTPLADQPDSVAEVYTDELIEWLAERYGFQGDDLESALAVFAGLNDSARQIFARQVLFGELLASGREFNDVDGPRPGSYLRGRRVIEAAFPERAAEGSAGGDLVMFGDAGIQTLNGGDIHLLTPSGAQTLGVEGTEPSGSAGVLTLGEGSIRQFSRDNILLGQSRIMTLFGGDIQAWSEKGDINAGRGSQTTQVYTPPKRVYDQWGNVTLSPQVPSSGAGIATLNPIPEVPPGDIDLIAPLGTIDAGEAGIRVSGDVNIAALHVVNADNIQVQGESTGIPVMAAVNVGALTSASAAASSAATAAQDTVSRARNEARQNQPSIFSVRILGFGSAAASDSGAGSSASAPMGASSREVGYQPDSMLQMVGDGKLSPSQLARLTPEERRRLDL